MRHLAENGSRIDLCSAQPTTYAEATSTYSLGSKVIPTGVGSASYSAFSDDPIDGRRLFVEAQVGISITTAGTVTHVAITDGVSELIYVVPLTSSKVVSAGNSGETSSWEIDFWNASTPD